jgi:regulation of enolase protein 1 (concanavalin A-like superfamily)
MRVFHLHRLGPTTEAMGRQDPPAPPVRSAPFGLYACSSLESSFEAFFDRFSLTDCLWKAHGA